jgi:hypothetical protein
MPYGSEPALTSLGKISQIAGHDLGSNQPSHLLEHGRPLRTPLFLSRSRTDAERISFFAMSSYNLDLESPEASTAAGTLYHTRFTLPF